MSDGDPVKPLDLTKPVQVRGGRPVRILCTDCKVYHDCPVLVEIVYNEPGYYETERYVIRYYSVDGRFYRDYSGTIWTGSPYSNLVNVPEKTHKFANVFNGGLYTGGSYRASVSNVIGSIHDSKDAADRARRLRPRAGILRLDFEDDKVVGVEFIKTDD